MALSPPTNGVVYSQSEQNGNATQMTGWVNDANGRIGTTRTELLRLLAQIRDAVDQLYAVQPADAITTPRYTVKAAFDTAIANITAISIP